MAETMAQGWFWIALFFLEPSADKGLVLTLGLGQIKGGGQSLGLKGESPGRAIDRSGLATPVGACTDMGAHARLGGQGDSHCHGSVSP